jgi:hypothetical protein
LSCFGHGLASGSARRVETGRSSGTFLDTLGRFETSCRPARRVRTVCICTRKLSCGRVRTGRAGAATPAGARLLRARGRFISHGREITAFVSARVNLVVRSPKRLHSDEAVIAHVVSVEHRCSTPIPCATQALAPPPWLAHFGAGPNRAVARSEASTVCYPVPLQVGRDAATTTSPAGRTHFPRQAGF